MIKRSSVTIKDIAKRLGLSTSTVSRALTGSNDISIQTKEAVLELASELDYQPNIVAQSLKSRQTNIIGILIPQTINPFYSAAIGGIQEVISGTEYSLMMSQSNESEETEKRNVQMMINTRVDGIIVSISSETIDYINFEKLKERNIPIVFLDRIIDEIETPKVFTDNYIAAQQATSHLIEQGCKKIARINGPKNLYSSQWYLKGYLDTIREFCMKVNDEYIISTDSHKPKSEIVEYTNYLLDLPEPPDAIFGIDDASCLIMMKVIKEKGLKIPDDIAMVGINNEFFCDYVEPSLTSIEVPSFKMGKVAAELILKAIRSNEEFNEIRMVPSRLKIRDSSRRIN